MAPLQVVTCFTSAHIGKTLQTSLLRNHWANQSQTAYRSSMDRGNGSLFAASGLHDMTQMAAMPIYGKHPLKIFFSGTIGPMILGLRMQHLGHVPIKI